MGRNTGAGIYKKENERAGGQGQGEGRTGGQSTTSETASNKQGNPGAVGGRNRGGAEKTGSLGHTKENLVDIPVPKAIVIDEGESISDTKVKPKRQRKSKQNNNSGVSANDLSYLISGAFELISTKAGEHWKVTPQESLSIATPLEKILDKMNLLEKVANISDGAMLFMAVSSITIPRVLISQKISAQKKIIKKQNALNGGVTNVQSRQSAPVPAEQPGQAQTTNTEFSKQDNEGIKVLESTNIKYDSPLYSAGITEAV